MSKITSIVRGSKSTSFARKMANLKTSLMPCLKPAKTIQKTKKNWKMMKRRRNWSRRVKWRKNLLPISLFPRTMSGKLITMRDLWTNHTVSGTATHAKMWKCQGRTIVTPAGNACSSLTITARGWAPVSVKITENPSGFSCYTLNLAWALSSWLSWWMAALISKMAWFWRSYSQC